MKREDEEKEGMEEEKEEEDSAYLLEKRDKLIWKERKEEKRLR